MQQHVLWTKPTMPSTHKPLKKILPYDANASTVYAFIECLCVCLMLVLYRKGFTDTAVFFCIQVSLNLSNTSLQYLQKWRYYPLEFCLKPWTYKIWPQTIQSCQQQYKQATSISMLLTAPGNDGRRGQMLSTSTDDSCLLIARSVKLCVQCDGRLGVRQCCEVQQH